MPESDWRIGKEIYPALSLDSDILPDIRRRKDEGLKPRIGEFFCQRGVIERFKRVPSPCP